MKENLKKFFKNIKDLVSLKNTYTTCDESAKGRSHAVHTGLLVKDYVWRVRVGNYHYNVYNDASSKFLNENRGKRVKFIIIDEFSHPELFKNVSFMDGKTYAKLIKTLS